MPTTMRALGDGCARRPRTLGSALCVGSLALSVLACASAPPKDERGPSVPEDPWDRLPRGAEWLHATRGFSGTHAGECAHVAERIAGEGECQGAMCGTGDRLAGEWRARCATLDAAHADAVAAAGKRMHEEADQAPSPCAVDHARMLRDGCSKNDPSCAATAQRWATRCGKSEGTPLAIELLERFVERRSPSPAQGDDAPRLDTRSCDELRATVAEEARCAQRFACEDAIAKLDLFRSRCVSDDGSVDMGTAGFELAILAGAGRKTPPVTLAKGDKSVVEVLVPLADGSGALLSLCDARLLDANTVLTARRACAAGKLVALRRYTVGGEATLRLATLDFPDDATFARRFPSLAATGEADARDAADAKRFGDELEGVAARAATAEGPRQLLALVFANGALLRSSARARKVLAAHDAALAPAVATLGKLKSAGVLRARLAPRDLFAVAARGKSHPFADLTAGGAVAVAPDGAALELDGDALLPQAMVAYRTHLAPLERAAKAKRPKDGELDELVTDGQVRAVACGKAGKRRREAEDAALRCVFGVDACDGARLDGLFKTQDEARTEVEAARRDMLVATTTLAASGRTELARIESDAGCEP